MFALPGWLWLLGAWLVLSVLVALGIARWFRWMAECDRDWGG